MADIFLSYAREDRAKAQQIAGALGARGLTVWWDRKVAPGMSYEDVIEQELTSAKWVIVLWSTKSVVSSWVRNEAGDALERGKLIPVLIANVRVPIAFRHMQTCDLSSWDGIRPDGEWDAVLERVGQPQEAASPITEEPAPVKRPLITPEPPKTSATPKLNLDWRSNRVRGIAGALVLGLVILIAIHDKSESTDETSSSIDTSSSDSSSSDSSSSSSSSSSSPAEGIGSALDLIGTSPNYTTESIGPGFEPDPYDVAVYAGGSTDLSTVLPQGCVGWASSKPDIILTFSGSGDRLRFYTTGTVDAGLAIMDPSGAWRCDDDSGDGTNAALSYEPSAEGTYKVWVSTIDKDMAHTTLHVSELRP